MIIREEVSVDYGEAKAIYFLAREISASPKGESCDFFFFFFIFIRMSTDIIFFTLVFCVESENDYGYVREVINS